MAKKKKSSTKPNKPDFPLTKEVATEAEALYGDYALPNYNPDELVGRKGLKIYQKMRTDEQVKACLTVKKFARVSTGWDIHPGMEDSSEAENYAKFIKSTINDMQGTFDDVLLSIMSALDFGFSCSEKIYQYIEEGEFKGKIGLRAIKTKEPFNLMFKTDEFKNLLGIYNQYTEEGKLGSEENPYPIDKFIIYSYNKEFSNFYGQSDLRSCFRSFFSKEYIIKWSNIYLERFGMPTTVIEYPKKKGIDKEVISALDDILKNLQAKSGIRIPEDIKLSLLEAKRQGQFAYESMIKLHDIMIAKAILVPSLLGFTQTEQIGSYALGKKHFDMFLFVLNKLGRDLEETIVFEQIIKPLMYMNYGQIKRELLPIFKFNSLDEEDIDAKSKIAERLVKAGILDPSEEWLRPYLNMAKRPVGQKEIEKSESKEEPDEPKIADETEDDLKRILLSWQNSYIKHKDDKEFKFRKLGEFKQIIENGIKKVNPNAELCDKIAFRITGEENDYISKKLTNEKDDSNIIMFFNTYIVAKLKKVVKKAIEEAKEE